jgi:ribosomal protein L35
MFTSLKKRLKKTKNKIIRLKCGKKHLLRKKNSSKKRRLSIPIVICKFYKKTK